MEARKWSLAAVRDVKAQIDAAPRASSTLAVRNERYHPEAALVTWFTIDPNRHRDQEALTNLIADSILVEEIAGEQRWSLKNDVRKRVLRQLPPPSLLTILDGIPRPAGDLLQTTFEAFLQGRPPSLDGQSAEELSATLQVADWLDGSELSALLPPVAEVRRRLEAETFLRPFRLLVGNHFRGRATELSTLASYVLGASDVDSLHQRPPLLIHGPGGMGKSTLIARFILDLTQRGADTPPVIYLDCDRPGLVAEEPLTLLAEAVRQLGIQFGDFQSAAQTLRAHWLADIAEIHSSASAELESVVLESVAARGRDRYLNEFGVFVDDLALASRPVLLVIDTFEEWQYRSRDFVAEVFQFLDQLQRRLPRLRTVLAGRNPVLEFAWESLKLRELDQEASTGFLEVLGVEPASLRHALARQLHGNPLSLRLAATAVKQQGVDLAGFAELERLADDTQIQGVLYRRILSHIHDDDVKRIAHPGLILRRITPELIRHVLAEPCGVKVDSDAAARRLFQLLKQELALVTPEGDAVRHRTDIRRVMLGPLRKDQPQKTEAIQRAAIAYYEPKSDLVSRAEEIYHRLLLDQTPADIEPRWLPGVEDSLRTALDELSGASRAYLASRLRIELYDADWDSVDQLTWEAYAARRAEDLIRLDRPYDALQVLQRRATRLPASALFWLEARILRQLGEVRAAREVARRGIAEAPPQPDSSWLDLFVLFAECEEALVDGADWFHAPPRFQNLAAWFPAEPRVLRFAFAYLRLAARLQYPGVEVSQLTSAALSLLEPLSETDIDALLPYLPPQPEFDRYRATTTAPAPQSASQSQVTYSLRRYDTGELVAALREALPSITAIINALRGIRIDPSTLARLTGSASALEAVIQWAAGEGRLDEFITSVAAYNPKASRLRAFLTRFAARIDYLSDDPFEASLLPGGRPFFGRRVLRDFLRQVATGKVHPGVLTIHGPPGSGKSYTAEFVHYIARQTRAFVFASFQLTAHWSLEDLVRSIHSRLDWRWDGDNIRDTGERRARAYADLIVNKARRSRRVTLLMLEKGGEGIRSEVLDFIDALAAQAGERAPLALILVELPCATAIQERLDELSAGEIAQGIRRIAAGARISVSSVKDIERITAAVLASAPTGSEFNSRVNEAAAEVLTVLAEQSRAVNLYISAANRDQEWKRQIRGALEFLERDGLIRIAPDPLAGESWQAQQRAALASAEIVLVLVSADYLASRFATEELEQAIDMALRGNAALVPLLLRPCAWQQTELRRFPLLPQNAPPLAYAEHPDAVLAELAGAIRRAVSERRTFRNQPGDRNIQ
jgi:hypothetical protein